MFEVIRDRVWKKVSNWKNSYLSQAGKGILLKLVAQNIPTFAMSIFLLPKNLCKDMVSVIFRFWWSYSLNDNKIKQQKWQKLGMSKCRGGLGFRDLVSFNKALLAKQIWHILQNPSSLASQILSRKYFSHGDILHAVLGSNPSFLWRSLSTFIPLVKVGLVWSIGNGRSIDIWCDKWVPIHSTCLIQTPVNTLPRCSKLKTRLILNLVTEIGISSTKCFHKRNPSVSFLYP